MFFSLILLLLLVIGGFIAFLFSPAGENLIKSQIELHGSQSLPSNVTIESIQLDFFQQLLKVRGLTLSHPKRGEGEYTTPHMMRIGEMTLRVDVAGAVGGKIHLLEASMVGSEVFFEGGLIDNNLKTFLSQLDDKKEKKEEKKEETRDFDFGAAMKEDKKEEKKEEKKEGKKEGMDLVVEKIEFRDSGVTFKLDGVPDFVVEKTKGFRLEAPNFVTSINGESKQATKEMSEQYVSHVLSSVVNYLEGLVSSLPDVLSGEIFDSISESVPDVLENLLTRDGGEEGESIKEAVDLISDFVGGEEEGEGEGGKMEEAAELISSFVGGGDGEEKEEGGAVELISDFLDGDDDKEKEEKKGEEEEEESFFEKIAENKEAQDMALGAAANLASSFF